MFSTKEATLSLQLPPKYASDLMNGVTEFLNRYLLRFVFPFFPECLIVRLIGMWANSTVSSLRIQISISLEKSRGYSTILPICTPLSLVASPSFIRLKTRCSSESWIKSRRIISDCWFTESLTLQFLPVKSRQSRILGIIVQNRGGQKMDWMASRMALCFDSSAWRISLVIKYSVSLAVSRMRLRRASLRTLTISRCPSLLPWNNLRLQ